MATTTSTENSGLLDELIPPFEEKYDLRVDVVAVGTGAAIELGVNGDADIIFVHARAAEDEFVEAGYGVNRRDVMYNDFVILGPPLVICITNKRLGFYCLFCHHISHKA
ncbi:MAG: substrate-binding domain-containing protein [Eubacteriales bacterium]